MADVEVLARLGGGVSRMDGVTRSTGSSELSGIELAGLLSGLDDEAMAWAILVYVGDMAKFEYCRELVRQHALSLRRRQQWRAASESQALVLADVAFEDSVSPNRCPVCRGVKHVAGRGCVRCASSGVVRLTKGQIATALDVSDRQFRDVWARRFAEVLGYVVGLESSVRAAVSRNSRQSDEFFSLGY